MVVLAKLCVEFREEGQVRGISGPQALFVHQGNDALRKPQQLINMFLGMSKPTQ